MILIADTNRIIAALIKDSTSREILLSDKFVFLTVGFTKTELKEHMKEILKKANISETALDSLLALIFGNIYVVDDSIIKNNFEDAKKIMDSIDPNDTPYIALVLSVENSGIWSDDKHFQKQNKVRIWKTPELMKLLD